MIQPQLLPWSSACLSCLYLVVVIFSTIVQARQRALGNIQFIGHLYRKKMLTEKIMHECIKKLLADVAAPKQEDLECLAKLMSTVGRQLDANPNAKMYMDAYFDRVAMLGKNMSLESRIRFMLQARQLLPILYAASV